MAATKNPKGLKSDKEWRDAIRRAVHETRKDPADGRKRKRLVSLARKLVERAEGGDVAALKEIGDRLDGKPTQGVELAADETITKIVREIVRAPNSNG